MLNGLWYVYFRSSLSDLYLCVCYVRDQAVWILEDCCCRLFHLSRRSRSSIPVTVGRHPIRRMS